jgi:hypothetical protein
LQALLVLVALGLVAAVVSSKVVARRRYAKLKLSGGRKSLALNLFTKI